MDRLIKQAKALINCIKIRLVQDKDNTIKLNENNEYIPFSISLTNPTILKYSFYQLQTLTFDFATKIITNVCTIITLLLLFLYQIDDIIINYIDRFFKIDNIKNNKILNEIFQYDIFYKNNFELSGWCKSIVF